MGARLSVMLNVFLCASLVAMPIKSFSAKASFEKIVGGRVIKEKEVEIRGAEQNNKIVMIRTEPGDQRLVVDLGPLEVVESWNVGIGDEIRASGQLVRLRDRIFLLANKVKVDGQIREVQRKRGTF